MVMFPSWGGDFRSVRMMHRFGRRAGMAFVEDIGGLSSIVVLVGGAYNLMWRFQFVCLL